jgi:hypothetical protein
MKYSHVEMARKFAEVLGTVLGEKNISNHPKSSIV